MPMINDIVGWLRLSDERKLVIQAGMSWVRIDGFVEDGNRSDLAMSGQEFCQIDPHERVRSGRLRRLTVVFFSAGKISPMPPRGDLRRRAIGM